jgi:hypothetical protein
MRESNIKVQGVEGTSLDATEEGINPIIGKFLIVPNATANLVSVSELTKHGITVFFFCNIATIDTESESYSVNRCTA